MKLLLKQAKIISHTSAYHGFTYDILIDDGKIICIQQLIETEADQVISHDNLHISIGWMDVFAHFADPGAEHKETLQTGALAAGAGGFTHVMLLPNTTPVIGTKVQVEYMLQHARTGAVKLLPIAAVSRNADGKELAEMYDMYNSGAVAFSDGLNSIQSPGLLLKALQYVKAIGATVIQLPDDKTINPGGLMHEGVVSTRIGLPGKPALAEELMIARDIELLRYTGSRLHITGISTRKGIEQVVAAKKEGLHLSCSVTPYHGFFSDEDLVTYDTNLKLNPPLRSMDDREAIKEALAAGKIDCLASHHLPQHWDDKSCEFEYAKYGMGAIENVFAAVTSYLDLEKFIELVTVGPRKIFGLPLPLFKEGEQACLTLFNPAKSYMHSRDKAKSRSGNNPFFDKSLTGEVIGIINNNQVQLNY